MQGREIVRDYYLTYTISRKWQLGFDAMILSFIEDAEVRFTSLDLRYSVLAFCRSPHMLREVEGICAAYLPLLQLRQP